MTSKERRQFLKEMRKTREYEEWDMKRRNKAKKSRKSTGCGCGCFVILAVLGVGIYLLIKYGGAESVASVINKIPYLDEALETLASIFA